ncbi:MAG TPA: hypothetical protein VHB78_03605 [Vicinamibacterales bacterium]|jgi:hypothetical protein|nr:hypothetical protein [Vicinamibacterales bacterium]
MVIRRAVAIALVGLLTAGAFPAFAQQPVATGSISGKATDEAKKPYTNYAVQLRDAESGQLVNTIPLDARGRFAFSNLELQKKFLVELLQVKDKKVVCTEGPFPLFSNAADRSNVNIDCGAAPAALWLLAAGAGTVAAVAVATESVSR